MFQATLPHKPLEIPRNLVPRENHTNENFPLYHSRYRTSKLRSVRLPKHILKYDSGRPEDAPYSIICKERSNLRVLFPLQRGGRRRKPFTATQTHYWPITFSNFSKLAGSSISVVFLVICATSNLGNNIDGVALRCVLKHPAQKRGGRKRPFR